MASKENMVIVLSRFKDPLMADIARRIKDDTTGVEDENLFVECYNKDTFPAKFLKLVSERAEPQLKETWPMFMLNWIRKESQMSQRTMGFFDSLHAQESAGKTLTIKQRTVLDRKFVELAC